MLLLTGLTGACSGAIDTDDRGPDAGNDAGNDATAEDASADRTVCNNARRCSADLKSILSACPEDDGRVIEVCPDDQACGGDTCVDPCRAAENSRSSLGCSFWTLPPTDPKNGPGSCFAVIVANAWTRPVTLQAELGAASLDISRSIYVAKPSGRGAPTYERVDGPLPPGEVGIVFLSQAPNLDEPLDARCPAGVVPALNADPITHGTAKTHAFHITTDAPVSTHSIFPYGGPEIYVPTATLLMPVSSWDNGYVSVSTARPAVGGEPPREEPRTLQIVASEDGTTVEMRPRVDLVAGLDVEAVAAGQKQTWTLSRGQVLQILQDASTSGSPIVSNKPIGVFGGSACTFLPAGFGYCDVTQQQIAPLAQWGSEYALVPFMPRRDRSRAREVVPWSLVGAVDGTTLTYDPVTPPGAPSALAAGEMVTFLTDAVTVVKSQDAAHPFHAAIYMTGGTYPVTSPPTTIGDPDFVNVVPSDQFLSRYVFFAEYMYKDTTLTVVRRKTASGFLPVELACAGEVTGWQPLGTDYEFAWLRITDDFAARPFPRGECGYGRHQATSEGPFSVTVWGLNTGASYGFAAGSGSLLLNTRRPSGLP